MPASDEFSIAKPLKIYYDVSNATYFSVETRAVHTHWWLRFLSCIHHTIVFFKCMKEYRSECVEGMRGSRALMFIRSLIIKKGGRFERVTVRQMRTGVPVHSHHCGELVATCAYVNVKVEYRSVIESVDPQ
ncbi:MAG: hypothetical protein JW795_05315 [Chitinivibrionales bacterium]|nr:hypothetical protein [Chitinivibrionales bacterium]